MTRLKKITAIRSMPITWVLLTGFLLRVYSAAARCVVNADAHHYIYQAQTIFNADWSQICSCQLKHISTYPFFTAMVFALVRDWIWAGLFVNIVFGTAALLPLYFLLRRFLDQTVSALCILVFAFIPTLVNSSGDIVRDPVFWFFITMGMLYFVRQWDERASDGGFRYDLIFSSLFFLLATATRIEGVLFLAVSPLYLILSNTEHKFKKLVYVLAPLVAAGAAMLFFIFISKADVATTLRTEQIWHEATQATAHYNLLDDQLKSMTNQQKDLLGEFLRRIREALWIMPLAVLFHNAIEVFFYPYALILFFGFSGIHRRIKEIPQSKYLLSLMLGGIIIIIVHLLQTWVFIHRFLAILILPSCLVIGWGLAVIVRFLQGKYHLKQKTAITLVAVFIVLTGLPKNLTPRESDKSFYREAAGLIQDIYHPLKESSITAARASRAYQWVLLYAYRKHAAPLCAPNLTVDIPESYDQFLVKFDQAGFSFFIYEERYWPKNRFDITTINYNRDFQLLGQWEHRDSGQIMILQRIEAPPAASCGESCR